MLWRYPEVSICVVNFDFDDANSLDFGGEDGIIKDRLININYFKERFLW